MACVYIDTIPLAKEHECQAQINMMMAWVTMLKI
jgi:hypothetical protein